MRAGHREDPTVSTAEALLHAVREEPDEDGPRLVYADWLDEHDQPERAEFIRLQCRLAGKKLSAEKEKGLRKREQALLDAHEGEWAAPLAGLVRSWRFRRGFVERVAMTPPQFVANAAALFRLAPVRHLVLVESNSGVEEAVASPHLAGVETLDFRDCFLKVEHVRHLADSPHLGGLRSLVLRFNNFGEEGLRVLAASRRMPSLTTLDLYETVQQDTTGVEALAAGPQWAGLERLVLGGQDSVEGMAVVLTRSPHLNKLTWLHLAFCQLGDADAAALAGGPGLPGLQVLDLSHNLLGDDGGRALAAATGLKAIKSLRLAGHKFSAKVRQGLQRRYGQSLVL
jgi:uncharacterized protein (TIGR02996 family)